MAIRKICPTSVSGARSTGFRTQPVPSIAAWAAGSASTANTRATGTGTVRVALTFSWCTVCTLLVVSFGGRGRGAFPQGRRGGEAELIGRMGGSRRLLEAYGTGAADGGE